MIPAGAIKRFQSTLPAREATSGSGQIMCPGRISIHASCKGSDHSAGWCRYPGQYFNPRFPRRKRLNSHEMKTQFIGFQSTLPAGEATHMVAWAKRNSKFQSTLPAGEATTRVYHYFIKARFQSTLPAGEATFVLATTVPVAHISIHASRGGSDVGDFFSKCSPVDFNPRFPRGKRHGQGTSMIQDINFNPRFPRGKRPPPLLQALRISYFNPRFPRGKRQTHGAYISTLQSFQSTLPAGEATYSSGLQHSCPLFQSTLPAGEATHPPRACRSCYAFQSTLPAGEATLHP